MRLTWWKILAIVLLIYTVIAGFLTAVPELNVLHQTIRNLYFHVPMWFAMTLLLSTSAYFSVKYLRTQQAIYDYYAVESVKMGVVLGILGFITGMIWGNYTWNHPLPPDPKIYGAAVSMLIYFAYLILRGSFQNIEQKSKVSAIYNIFAFATFIPLIFILPRFADSLHPGNGGNPGFNAYDLNNHMRLIFYPAILGWFLLSWWIVTLKVRIRKIQNTLQEMHN